MAKDPAFLFYYQDFLVGTSFMTLEETGAYIKLLCFQAAKGPLSEEDILKKIPLTIWHSICCNFICANGKYTNKRLEQEITKRRLYCENRRKNLHMAKHMDKHMNRAMTGHMENENENIYKGGMGGKILPGMPKKNFAPVKKPKDIFKGGAKADIEKALKG